MSGTTGCATRRQNNVINDEASLIGDEGKGMTPDWLQALTLGCAMKMNNVFSKVYSVAVNGEEAVLSGGSCANLALWLCEKQANGFLLITMLILCQDG